MAEKQNSPRPPKAKGPIRWGAVIPFTIFVLIVALYTHFFFDLHLRKTMEWGLGRALGSEVNVAELETSFWNAHLRIAGIEFTDAEKPQRNSLSIGEIRFGMLWDALLRAKVVVNEAVIEQLEFAKPRKTPGWVAPPELPKMDDGKSSALAKEADQMKKDALNQVQKDQNANVFGDIAALLGGGSAQVQMDQLQQSLSSKKMAQDLEARVKAKQQEWGERIKKLPQGAEFQALGDRLGKVKTKDFKTPQELESSLKEFDTIFKEADAKIKIVQSANTDLQADIKGINDDVKTLEAQIKADVKSLEQHFKIPQIDAKALTLALFRKHLDPYLMKFQAYRGMAEKYVPPNLMKKGSKEPDPSIQPRPRANGVSYEFGHPHSYPLVWIKRTAISSQAGTSPYSGNIKGEILDLTSNQVLIGKPTIMNIAGDFPSAQISGLTSKLVVDNRQADSMIDLDFGIKAFAVEGRDLVDSPDAHIAFRKATGSLALKSSLKALRELSMSLDNRYTSVEYDVSSKNETANTMLKSIFAGIPVVSVEGRIEGTVPNLAMNLDSNLGPELRKGLEKEINAKIGEARAKIESYVNGEVGKIKAQIDSQVAQIKGQNEKEIQKVQAQAEAQKKQAESRADAAKKDAENQAKSHLENEAKKAADELKKKFGF